MVNHMAEVAKMLGVELGEEFMCNNGYKYVLREDGIVDTDYEKISVYAFSNVLNDLLNGKLVIERKPWKPSEGERYWWVTSNGSVDYCCWTGDMIDFFTYKLGNCYRTKEEAEVNCDKWVSFYASDEVLEV